MFRCLPMKHSYREPRHSYSLSVIVSIQCFTQKKTTISVYGNNSHSTNLESRSNLLCFCFVLFCFSDQKKKKIFSQKKDQEERDCLGGDSRSLAVFTYVSKFFFIQFFSRYHTISCDSVTMWLAVLMLWYSFTTITLANKNQSDCLSSVLVWLVLILTVFFFCSLFG